MIPPLCGSCYPFIVPRRCRQQYHISPATASSADTLVLRRQRRASVVWAMDLKVSKPATSKGANTVSAVTAIGMQEIKTKDRFVFQGITKHHVIYIVEIDVNGCSDNAFLNALKPNITTFGSWFKRKLGI